MCSFLFLISLKMYIIIISPVKLDCNWLSPLRRYSADIFSVVLVIDSYESQVFLLPPPEFHFNSYLSCLLLLPHMTIIKSGCMCEEECELLAGFLTIPITVTQVDHLQSVDTLGVSCCFKHLAHSLSAKIVITQPQSFELLLSRNEKQNLV